MIGQYSARMTALADHGSNVYSQSGEDGIVSRIFEIIGFRSRLCIEFGAWDGFHLSNTASLWTNGWRGVLIEADGERFSQLLRNVAAYDVKAIHGFVRCEGDDTLERILLREGVSDIPDLLAIDIDGDDYYVFESLENLRPRVIICEYNPTIPPHVELVADPGNYFGCSALALVKLAERKGYRLVACTESNLILVVEEEFHLFHGYETDLQSIFVRKHLVYLMTGYAGDYVLSREPPYGFTSATSQSLRGDFYQIPRSERDSRTPGTLRDELLAVRGRLLATAWRRLLQSLRLSRPIK